jgi:hypothetical protein
MHSQWYIKVNMKHRGSLSELQRKDLCLESEKWLDIYGQWIKDVGLSRTSCLFSKTSDDTLHLSVHRCFSNDALIKSNDTASNHRVTVNNKLENIWKEAVVANFKALSRYLSEGTVENHEEYQVCIPADIWTAQISNTSQQLYFLSEVAVSRWAG